MEKDMSNPDINSYTSQNSKHLSKVQPFSELPEYYRHIRKEIVSVVPKNALKILDVGCGAGMLGKALKEQNPRRYIVGIELNDSAFYYATKNLDQTYHSELETFEPPFNQGEFDCIIFADILEHLREPWTIARRYAAFLRFNGTMVASIPNIRHLPTLRQVVELGSWQYQDEGILDRTHLRFFTKKDFVELLYQADVECNSVFYLGGKELYSLRPKEPERVVRVGNLALSNVSEEEFLELCAYQLLFVGTYKPKKQLLNQPIANGNFPEKGSEENKNKVNLVSVVVPWWDHSELLELWENNFEHLQNTEVIFIDNGSTPAAKSAINEFCNKHNVILIRNEDNQGFSAANNQGLDIAKSEYVLFLNNDVEILDLPIKYLCDCACDGIAGPGFVQNEIRENYLEGWALCARKSVMQALGGWCEDYGPGYWDDVDLSHRAKIAGYPLTPIPDIDQFFRHKTNVTGRDGRLDQLALHSRNRGIFLKKYYQSLPKVIIDGVFFQLFKTGIARVWFSLLEEWSDKEFAKYIVILDRSGTAPQIPGIRYRSVPLYDYSSTDADRTMLQQICDEEDADLFISTYYTTPLSTPSVFMAYDMIPEVLGWDMNNPMWQEKHRAIQQASAFLAISENTARDLVRFFPEISPELVRVAPCGVKSSFYPANLEEVNSFRTKYGISKPYFILVGTGGGYKNTILFFQAFAQLYSKQGFDIVCTGSGSLLSPELRAYSSGSVVHMLQLSDQELRAAYSGAVSLVYPSKYEGFGLPILEAMACGCPVITCANASIPEVAGEAALYVNDTDSNELTNALCDVQKPDVRNSLIAAGLAQAKKFSWSKMAEIVSAALVDATLLPLNLRDINLIIFPDWSQPEEVIGRDLEEAMRSVATHSQRSDMTLLIDTSGIADEEANFLLSGIVMNLLMQEDLDISDSVNISLVGRLSIIQWEALLPRLKARLVLEYENKQAIAKVKADSIPFYSTDSFVNQKIEQFIP
ncbi:glycosyltransferase [Coleofasciculus chthonoplastes]|uniref:glycosyltransferase n=1 Tax=Coleofasciculus chthonoplastes TaxID=64178 RepID=UPI0032F1D6C8